MNQAEAIIKTEYGSYSWDSSWPGIYNAKNAGVRISRTMGVAYSSKRNQIVVFHEGDPSVLIFSIEGELVHSFGGHWPTAHGCTLVTEDGIDYLWLTCRKPSKVEKYDLDGNKVQVLNKPDSEIYKPDEVNFQPADVCVWDDQIWMSDGYGLHIVSRYDLDGTYIDSLEQGDLLSELGRFANPHALRVDNRPYRGDEPLMAITDRGNKRIRWYDKNGRLVEWVDHICHSPSAFAFHNDLMLVPEMFTGVKLIHEKDNVIADIGSNPEVLAGKELPPQSLNHPGMESAGEPPYCAFPHSCCTLPNGDFLFTDGVDEGRLTWLRRSE